MTNLQAFKTLAISGNSDFSTVRNAFQRFARILHPKSEFSIERKAEKYKAVCNAYVVLSQTNPSYDTTKEMFWSIPVDSNPMNRADQLPPIIENLAEKSEAIIHCIAPGALEEDAA